MDKVLTRLRSDEGGFGLIELVIAMTVLNVGLLALVASLNSGAYSLARATKLSTAATLAESRMELYRALLYAEIRLDNTEHAADADSAYTAEPYDDPGVFLDTNTTEPPTVCPGPVPVGDPCDASYQKTGPDGRTYRIDTYITRGTPPNAPTARPVKTVTVVVRDTIDTTKVYVRQQSTFDISSG